MSKLAVAVARDVAGQARATTVAPLAAAAGSPHRGSHMVGTRRDVASRTVRTKGELRSVAKRERERRHRQGSFGWILSRVLRGNDRPPLLGWIDEASEAR